MWFTKQRRIKLQYMYDIEMCACKAAFDKWWDDQAQPALKLAADESADFAQAMALGVFVGESAREKASNLGGKTGPEILGFQIGLAGGPIARKKMLDIVLSVMAGASVPVWAGGFLEAFVNILIGALQKPDKGVK